jgi:hypothetical protein
MSERQGRIGLHPADREVRADILDHRQLQQAADEEFLVMLEIGYHHLKQEIGLARDQMCRHHLRHGLDRLL